MPAIPHLVWVLLIGFVIGVIAKLLMPGRDPGGCVITSLLGVAGAFVASFLGQLAGFYRAGERVGFIGAVLGAIIVLAVYRSFAGKR